MSPWLLAPVMIAPFCYATSIFTCGCGEKEVERIRKEAAQEQQRNHNRQQQLKVAPDTSAEHHKVEKSRTNSIGSGEVDTGVPVASAPAQKPLPQPLHPPPAAAQQSANKPIVAEEGGDDGYEACPDLTPQELQRIAAQS
ncbi:hypothetical protein Aduo_000332 [Ancylostoma duodenale]